MKIVVIFLALITSCGKAPSMPKGTNEKSGLPLNGRTNSEILDLKYNNKINLKCELRVQEGEKVDLSLSPTDEFTWSILGDVSSMRFLNYKIDKKELIIVVKVISNLKFLSSMTHINEKKQEFYLQYSPILTIDYRRASKKILTNGTIHNRDSFDSIDLFENIPTRIFTMTTEEYDEVVTEDVRCTLMTNINPDYADQWVRVK